MFEAASLTRSLSTSLLLSATVPAQGGIAWPAWSATPKTSVVRVGANEYDVYVSGWVTRGSPGTFGDEYVAAGVGLGTGTVREVDKSEFKNETTGETASLAELFPFVKNTRTKTDFQALDPTKSWTGFLAKAAGPVQGFRAGTLVFQFRPTFPVDPATLVRQLTGAIVVVAEADSSGAVQRNSHLVRFPLSPSPAELMYYKFDRQVGDVALNYLTDFAGAAREAALSSAGAFAAGRSEGGLRGGDSTGQHRCDTRWKGGLYGELTLAWFMRQRTAPGSGSSRLFRGPGNLRCGTDAAGKGLRFDGLLAGGASLLVNADVQTPAAAGWVHVALVVAPTPGNQWQYRFALGGVVRAGGSLGAAPSIPFANDTLVLGGTAADPGVYDIDEFRLWSTALPVPRLAAFAQGPTAAVGLHGDGGGCALRSTGLPRVGNAGYALEVFGAPSSPLGVVIGFPTGTPFPIQGHLVYVHPILLHWLATSDAQGRFSMALPLPNDPSLRGRLAYSQAHLADGGKLRVSNAHATSIE